MKCPGCKTSLTDFNPLPLQISYSSSSIKCPLCNFVMLLHYNRRQQVWETLDEYEERRKGWRKGSKDDPKT